MNHEEHVGHPLQGWEPLLPDQGWQDELVEGPQRGDWEEFCVEISDWVWTERLLVVLNILLSGARAGFGKALFVTQALFY